VQAVVEEAVARLLRVDVRLTVAGRTDAGVHATGQVAHADLPEPIWTRAPVRLVRRLRGVLPPDVRVRAVEAAPPDFDARFSALSRAYAYRVTDDPAGPEPLRRADTVAWRRPLDVAALRAASRPLLGLHDFAAFCRRRPGATTVRTLTRLDWDRDADGVVTARVEADAFCHSMVRSLVGALLAVGEVQRPPAWPAELLARGEAEGARAVGVTVAPAAGLTLTAVRYPPDDELLARTRTTRAVRSPAAPGTLPEPGRD
jgi:tRNA pseudouridine38-40 synthase